MGWLAQLFGAAAGRSAVLSAERRAALERWRALPAADLRLAHEHTRYVVVDVETSGLDVGRDRLIAIGAVAVKGGLIDAQDSFEVTLRQDEVSGHENILVHGIGISEQRQGVEPAEALLSFLDYIGKSPLVAYHALFDQAMLDKSMRRFLGYAFEQTWIDLAWVLPEYFRFGMPGRIGLDDWLARFGIENLQRHNAVADCLAAAQLLQIVMAVARKAGDTSPQALVDLESNRRWLGRDK